MRHTRFVTLLASLGAATACETDRATAPPIAAPQPAAEVVALSLATLLGKATVDEPELVGAYTSLASSSDGTQRIAYYDESNQRLKYAACADNCTAAASWQQSVIDPEPGTGVLPSLRVRSGVRHVVYQALGNLRYATCGSECQLQESWKTGVTILYGRVPSLTFGDDGRRHLTYMNWKDHRLLYVTCLSDCNRGGNWQGAIVDGSLFAASTRSRTSIAVGPGGRLHISYSGGGKLKYATCLTSCANAANWQKLVVPGVGSPGWFNALAVDGNGVRHISHFDSAAKNLMYSRCAANCTNSAGWKTIVVDKGDGTYGTDVGRHTSLAVGGTGKVHVSYYDRTGGRLKYASCAAGDCLLNTNWQRQYVDDPCVFKPCPGNVGGYTSLRLGGGRVHVSYYNFTSADLKYAELTQ